MRLLRFDIGNLSGRLKANSERRSKAHTIGLRKPLRDWPQLRSDTHRRLRQTMPGAVHSQGAEKSDGLQVATRSVET
jgi:hypothetical protein